MGTYLDKIVAAHRATAARDERELDHLIEAAMRVEPPRSFAAALRDGSTLAVIAEIKRRSPSRGDLHPTLDPAAVAVAYERGGASCLSVLTDTDFFGGGADDFQAARAACALPALRKDFTVDARDLADARLMGADAVLLIVAALTDVELRSFLDLAATLALTALVEVHDERELGRAAAAGALVIGVNQRDLTSFEIDRELAVTLAPRMPEGSTTVAESGIRGVDDAVAIASAGYHAVLVGESLVTSPEPAEAVRAIAEVARCS